MGFIPKETNEIGLDRTMTIRQNLSDVSGYMSTSQPNPAIEPTVQVVIPKETVEEVEVLQASIKAASVAQIVIAVIGLIYLLKLVLVTTLVSILLAYVLEPPVTWLRRFHIPRWGGALIVVLVTLALFAGLAF